MMNHIAPDESRKRPLSDRERSAMWHARQRAVREGRRFHMEAELAAYHQRVSSKAGRKERES